MTELTGASSPTAPAIPAFLGGTTPGARDTCTDGAPTADPFATLISRLAGGLTGADASAPPAPSLPGPTPPQVAPSLTPLVPIPAVPQPVASVSGIALPMVPALPQPGAIPLAQISKTAGAGDEPSPSSDNETTRDDAGDTTDQLGQAIDGGITAVLALGQTIIAPTPPPPVVRAPAALVAPTFVAAAAPPASPMSGTTGTRSATPATSSLSTEQTGADSKTGGAGANTSKPSGTGDDEKPGASGSGLANGRPAEPSDPRVADSAKSGAVVRQGTAPFRRIPAAQPDISIAIPDDKGETGPAIAVNPEAELSRRPVSAVKAGPASDQPAPADRSPDPAAATLPAERPLRTLRAAVSGSPKGEIPAGVDEKVVPLPIGAVAGTSTAAPGSTDQAEGASTSLPPPLPQAGQQDARTAPASAAINPLSRAADMSASGRAPMALAPAAPRAAAAAERSDERTQRHVVDTTPVTALPPQQPRDTAVPALDGTTTAAASAAPADMLVQQQLTIASDNRWLDRLAHDIASSAGTGQDLRFQLSPQHLGRLDVSIAQSADGASVRMTTDSETTRRILVDAQPKLVAEARAQGLKIADTQVDLGQSNPNMGGGGRGADPSAGQTGGQMAGQSGGQHRQALRDQQPFASRNERDRSSEPDRRRESDALYA